MTNKEAILELRRISDDYRAVIDYKTKDSILMAIHALSKQMPEKTINSGLDYGNYNICPRCDSRVNSPYCPYCGQKLKWEDEE